MACILRKYPLDFPPSLPLVVLQLVANSFGEEDFCRLVSWLGGRLGCLLDFFCVLLSPDDCSNSPGRSYVEEEWRLAHRYAPISDPI